MAVGTKLLMSLIDHYCFILSQMEVKFEYCCMTMGCLTYLLGFWANLFFLQMYKDKQITFYRPILIKKNNNNNNKKP